MKRVTFSFLLVLAAAVAFGGATQVSSGWEFSEVTVIQHWPLNRSVDIKFFVRQVDGQASSRRAAKLKVSIGDRDLPEAELDNLWIRGEGRKCLVWTPAQAGYPAELNNVAVTLTVAEEVREVGYLVVDLASGKRSYKPLSFASEVNCDTYKTTHMAFRYIPSTRSAAWRNAMGKDTFRIGSDGTRTDLGITDGDRKREGTANITLTKSFFFGVFPLTRKQYALLGGSVSSQDAVPVRNVSYDFLRGTDGTNTVNGTAGCYCFPKSTAVDGNAPVGRLRSRTGLAFDFPTEAEWEYAARAGNEGEYLFDESGLTTAQITDKLNAYGANKEDSTVGTKLPNAWGIYDLIGCCHQWTTTCCDDNKTKHADATDPLGMTTQYGSGPFRVCKGSHARTGGGDTQRRVQRVAYRMLQRSNCQNGTLNGTNFTAEQNNTGCRLSLRLED